jgi:molybdopterin synthase catalytic subunit
MTAVRLLDIRDAPLSLDEVYAAVTDPAAGGICVFIGTVRDHDEGQGVSALGYSSHPTSPSATWRSSSRLRRRTVRRRSRPAGA